MPARRNSSGLKFQKQAKPPLSQSLFRSETLSPRNARTLSNICDNDLENSIVSIASAFYSKYTYILRVNFATLARWTRATATPNIVIVRRVSFRRHTFPKSVFHYFVRGLEWISETAWPAFRRIRLDSTDNVCRDYGYPRKATLCSSAFLVSFRLGCFEQENAFPLIIL